MKGKRSKGFGRGRRLWELGRGTDGSEGERGEVDPLDRKVAAKKVSGQCGRRRGHSKIGRWVRRGAGRRRESGSDKIVGGSAQEETYLRSL